MGNTSNIIVEVEDINDNPPQFLQASLLLYFKCCKHMYVYHCLGYV